MPSLKHYFFLFSLYCGWVYPLYGQNLETHPSQTISVESLFEAANTAYIKNNYSQAIECYEACLSYGASPQLYFNLQDAYLKEGLIGRALLAYERLGLLAPYSQLKALAFEKIKHYGTQSHITFAQKIAHSLPSPEGWTWALSLSVWSIVGIGFISFLRPTPYKFTYSLRVISGAVCLLSLVASWGWYTDTITGFIVCPTALKLAPTAQSPYVTELAVGEWVRIEKSTESYSFITRHNSQKGWILKADMEPLVEPPKP